MVRQLRPALLMTFVLTALTGVLYPLGITAISQLLFPDAANGSLTRRNGRIVGSRLIGQSFTTPQYFHPRPSASGYDATASGGSNLGPTNPDLVKRLQKDALAYREATGSDAPIPADAITASASGLDPDISPANAMLQVSRVARARHVRPEQIRSVLQNHIERRQFGIFGEPRVNVLELNLALDKQLPLRAAAR